MKRFLCLLLSLAMILCTIVACGDKKCEHSGGKATCTTPAICEQCGVKYGEVDEDNHTKGEGWSKTGEEHTKIYLCCGNVAEKSEPHNWFGGVCLDCDYTCVHKDGEANCKSGAVCSICEKVYTEKEPTAHTGEVKWEIKKATHKGIYDCCFAVSVAEESHEWVDGVCQECKYECSHSGGKASCTGKAICENCGVQYGELDPQNHADNASWSIDSKKHTKKYNCCGVVEIEDEAHMLNEGVCTVCGNVCAHTGGVATCVNRAICTTCGVAYGELDQNNHVGTKEQIGDFRWEYTCCGLGSVG